MAFTEKGLDRIVTVACTLVSSIALVVAAKLSHPSERHEAIHESPPVQTAAPIQKPVPVPRADTSALTPDGILAVIDSTPQLRQVQTFKALYAGRRLTWTGIVDNVYTSRTGKLTMILSTRGDFSPISVVAEFDTTWREQLSALRKRDTVRVSGTISDAHFYLSEIDLKAARLEAR